MAWFTLKTLGRLVTRHRADDAVAKAIDRAITAGLVLIDDIGLLPVPAEAAEALFRVIDAAYGRRSVAISSYIRPGGFDELLAATIATSTCRSVHAPRPHRGHRRRLLLLRSSPRRQGGEPTDLTLVGRIRVHGRGEHLTATGENHLRPRGRSRCPWSPISFASVPRPQTNMRSCGCGPVWDPGPGRCAAAANRGRRSPVTDWTLKGGGAAHAGR